MEIDESPGIAEYVASIKRRRRLMVWVGLPTIAAAFVLATALPRKFISAAEFQFEQSAIAEVVGTNSERRSNDDYEDEYVTKLSDSIERSDNLEKLRSDLHLDSSVVEIHDAILVEMLTQRILDPQSGRLKDVNSGFKLGFQSRDPETALKVAKWLADAVFSVSRQSRRAKSAHAAEFLGSEADRYRVQIAQLETKLADFKSKHVNELPDAARSNMDVKDRTERDIEDVQQQIRALGQNRIFLEAQMQQARSANPDAESVRTLEEEYRRKLGTYDANHPDMIALKRQIDVARRTGGGRSEASLPAQLEAQKAILAQTRQRYSEDHPDVRRLQRTIADLQARIDAGEKSDPSLAVSDPVVVQLQTQLRSGDNQIGSLQTRLSELRGKMAHLDSNIGSSPQVEKEYQDITRDLGLARDKYDQMLKQKMDAEFTAAASLAGSGDEFRLNKAPSLPLKPSKPPRLAIEIIGIILGMIFALIAALGAEALDQTVRGTRDIKSVLGVTPVAIIPEIRNSIFNKRRFRHLKTLAASMLIGVPALWIFIHLVVR
ncbi:MAG: hypothetical protein M3N50_07640 [Pseudomonadota bacterium]|nr:hypothetical protein [Pseudomonadota bacterium]